MTSLPTNPAPPTGTQKGGKKGLDEDDRRAFTTASSELLFVLLPFIVIGITLAHRGEFRTIFSIPEWSIVSAVIVGQAIVKVASASVGRSDVKKEAIILIMSALLVCLLVPILVILAIVLTSLNMSLGLAVAQATFFLLGSTVFWLASAIDSLFGVGPRR